MKVLFIGNNNLEQDLLRLALTRIESEVELVGIDTCEDAFADFLKKKSPTPEYIILDADLPAIDANACLIMLKESPFTRLSKVILYSGSENTADVQFMLSHGAASHLFKSNSFALLCHNLSNLFAKIKRNAS
jgi:DNA-binding NarL/FixJ family response regulator